jgi:hypothetical protein
MIDLHTFVLVSVAAAILLVGVLAWLVDSGLSDKGKVYVKYSLFALVASLVGLFFLIEDDSEFEYGGWEKQAQQKATPRAAAAEWAAAVAAVVVLPRCRAAAAAVAIWRCKKMRRQMMLDSVPKKIWARPRSIKGPDRSRIARCVPRS